MVGQQASCHLGQLLQESGVLRRTALIARPLKKKNWSRLQWPIPTSALALQQPKSSRKIGWVRCKTKPQKHPNSSKEIWDLAEREKCPCLKGPFNLRPRSLLDNEPPLAQGREESEKKQDSPNKKHMYMQWTIIYTR